MIFHSYVKLPEGRCVEWIWMIALWSIGLLSHVFGVHWLLMSTHLALILGTPKSTLEDPSRFVKICEQCSTSCWLMISLGVIQHVCIYWLDWGLLGIIIYNYHPWMPWTGNPVLNGPYPRRDAARSGGPKSNCEVSLLLFASPELWRCQVKA